MAKNKEKKPSIPEQFKTAEEAGEYWDTHDLTDFEDVSHEVEFQVEIEHRAFLTALEPTLAKRLAEVAHKQGISTETLINVWLTEKIEKMA